MDWAAIIVGSLSLVGVAVTAWKADQSKKREAEVKRDELAVKRAAESAPNWPGFVSVLEERVEKQDRKIDELFTLVGQLRTDLDVEQRRSNSLQHKIETFVAYISRLMTWTAEVAPGHTPPSPPSDIHDYFADMWRPD